MQGISEDYATRSERDRRLRQLRKRGVEAVPIFRGEAGRPSLPWRIWLPHGPLPRPTAGREGLR